MSRHEPGLPSRLWRTRTAGWGPPNLPQGERLRVLLVEDDEGDAFLVGELLAETDAAIDLVVATSLNEARQRIAGVDCVLLDLGLPDAQGLDGLRQVLEMPSSAAVCVLTGRSDEHLGIGAVAEGAQDYLVKGQVDGILLTRALRYAVERKRADENARRLREIELRQAESARLERGLLPQPLMETDEVAVHTFYRPGRHAALIGGDFYDVVQTRPDRIDLIVGDVCGHGVDEAALGVELRVAWRALVLAGVPDDEVLPALEQVLMSERRLREIFATVATARLDLAANRATVRLAGHPPPLLLAGGRVAPGRRRRAGCCSAYGPAAPSPTTWSSTTDDWSLLMYTDGLIEGRVGDRRRPARRAGPERPARRAGEPRGAAARAAGLAGRPGRGDQRRPARRRRRDAAGQPGRWPMTEAEELDAAAAGRHALRRRRLVLLLGLAAAEAAVAAQNRTHIDTLLNKTGPLRVARPGAARRPGRPGDRRTRLRGDRRREPTWPRTTAGWQQEREAGRRDATRCSPTSRRSRRSWHGRRSRPPQWRPRSPSR